MVYFTLKLLRFLVRAFVKLLLLPVTVIRWVLGRRDDEESWDDFEEGIDSDADESGEAPAASSGGSVSDATADTATTPTEGSVEATTDAVGGIRAWRFGHRLAWLGLVSGVVSVFAPIIYAGPVYNLFDYVASQGFWFAAPVAVTGVAALGLNRGSRWGWYLGVAWAVAILPSFFMRDLPALFLGPTAGVWSGFGALGYMLLGSGTGYDTGAILGSLVVTVAVLGAAYRDRPGTWTRAAEPGAAGAGTESAPAGEAATGSASAATTGQTADSTTASATANGPSEGRGPAAEAGPDGSASATDVGGDDGVASSEPTASTPDVNAADAAVKTDEATASDATTESAGTDAVPAASDDTGAESDGVETADDTTAAPPGDADGVDAYRERLHDPDPTARRTAVEALADHAAGSDVQPQAVIDDLTERMRTDDDPTVRIAACEALGRLGTGAHGVRARLEEMRLDPNGDVSRAASRALRHID